MDKQKTNSNGRWAVAFVGVCIAYFVGYGEGQSAARPNYTPNSYYQVAADPAPSPSAPAQAEASALPTHTSTGPQPNTNAEASSDGSDYTSIPSYQADQVANYAPDRSPTSRTDDADKQAIVAGTEDSRDALATDSAPVATVAQAPALRPAWDLPTAITNYTPPTRVAPVYGCSETGSCYGDISTTTGLPKTTYVHGYFRSNGTYVGSYYRSHR